jgi:hypothetical protein
MQCSGRSAFYFRSRSRSPGRPQLALVICPDYEEFPDYGSPLLSPPGSSSPCLTRSSAAGSRFPYPASPRPLAPHALARTRAYHPTGGWETSSSSLPCSPVLARLGPLSRELASLPGSPTLPRIHISEVRAWTYSIYNSVYNRIIARI